MLSFTEENHEYKFDGIVVPSVTQVIKGAGLVNFDYVSKELLEEKADLGSKVHKTTELYDMGILDLDELHPTLKAYLDGWINFKKDFGFTHTEIETEYYHPKYKFAGRLDRVGMINGKLSIVDIKSGAKHKSHSIQTAAYQLLYDFKPKKEQIKKRYAVYLSETGYKVEEHTNVTDRNIFLAALTIFNYKGGL